MRCGALSEALLLWCTAVVVCCQAHQLSNGSLQERSGPCQLTKGSWCPSFLSQTALPFRESPRGSVQCPGNCNNVGSCNYDTGVCMCPAGWAGRGCENIEKRPCTNRMTRKQDIQMGNFGPQSHIDPVTKEDLGWLTRGFSYSRCAGVCDDDIAACYCGQGSKHQRIPAPPGSPPGTPPIQRGRPLQTSAKPSTDGKGNKLVWGPAYASVEYDSLYGPQGWCNAEPRQEIWKSKCIIDGVGGPYCQDIYEAFCPNQCTGHGNCQAGFCKCHAGWYGHDCSRKRAGLPLHDSDNFTVHRPWLNPVVEVPPASMDPPTSTHSRKRPFIYVYDIPPKYNARMLEYSNGKSLCMWRKYDVSNATNLIPGSYNIETALHEMFLTSSHRTFDPEEADFFYVPTYLACMMLPVLGYADFPWWHQSRFIRPYHAANMIDEVAKVLQAAHPWWQRNNGRDHIWLAPHDEGACYFPTQVYNNSIILTHWGRMDLHHESSSGYLPDNYSMAFVPFNSSVDWRKIYEGHPCYNPRKDLVIPGFKFPSHFQNSPLLGAAASERPMLMYFRGDCGYKRRPMYSRGIRQKLRSLAQEDNWKEKYNIVIGTTWEVEGDYSTHLSQSKFCLAPPGDGYAMRVEDAILHGCVPVIIMDNVHAVFESLLDYQEFSVRVTESEVHRIPEILGNITTEQLLQLQTQLAKVWTRFVYTGNKMYREELRRKIHSNLDSRVGAANLSHPYESPSTWFEEGSQDAFTTIMAWLYRRINGTTY